VVDGPNNFKQSIFKSRKTRLLLLKTTFNNISVISWLSVLLVEKIREDGENHRHAKLHWQILSHNDIYGIYLVMCRNKSHNFSGDQHQYGCFKSFLPDHMISISISALNFRCQCTQQKLQSICAVLTFVPQHKKT
jgi:hypothetical protein